MWGDDGPGSDRPRRSGSDADAPRRGPPQPRRYDDEPMPPLGSIHQAKVKSIQPFGAFVELQGFRRNALVHISELASHRVEAVGDVLELDEAVKVKIIKHSDDGKLSASVKWVDQETGKDLDPDNTKVSQGGPGRGRGQAPIELGAVFDTKCPKCGGSGHLGFECFNTGKKQYDMVEDEWDDKEKPPAAKESVRIQGGASGPNATGGHYSQGVGRGASAVLPAWMTNPGMAAGFKSMDELVSTKKSSKKGTY